MSRFCTAGASASRSRSASSARCVTIATISALSSPADVKKWSPHERRAVKKERFEQLVAEAINLIPTRFRREMQNIAVVVEDEPAPALLEEMEIEPPDSL